MGRPLGDNFLHYDINAVKDNGQQELHALMAAIEADVEEGVVDKPEFLDGLKIFGIEAGGKHAHGHHPFLG